MVLRLDIHADSDKTVKVLNGIKKRMKSEPIEMTADMAIIFRRKVIKYLSKVRPDHTSAGHNTPTSLQQRLHLGGTGDGGNRVYFDNREEPNLPTIVEFGTAPSEESSRGPFDRGSKPKWFWRDAIRDFKRNEHKMLIERYGRRIVWGRK